MEENEQDISGSSFDVSGDESDQTADSPGTIEVVPVDYSSQFEIIIQQQQVCIAVSCMIFGALLVGIIFNILKRYIG